MTDKSPQYDIIVIGAGSGGLSVSLFMNKIGLKVLLVEKTDLNIGGDCLNYGCVPSKALIHISRIVRDAKKATAFGFELKGDMDIRKVTDYIRERQNIIRRHENADYFRKEGLDVALGTASFKSGNSICVSGKAYSGRRIVLASGTRPRSLEIPGIRMVDLYNNESIFDIRSLPKSWLVIGGGPIGIEIGQALSRLGGEITIVHRGNMILPRESSEIAKILLERLNNDGIRFLKNAEPLKFNSRNEAVIVQNGQNITVHFDAVFVATGRYIDLGELNVEAAGIKTVNNKINVNRYLQTSNKRVYLCGDIAGDLQFSHVAEFHARILLNNFFSPFRKRLDYRYLSWVTFTDPEIATFGLTEKQLDKKRIPYKKLELNFSEDDRAIISNYTYGRLILYLQIKKLFRKEKILGGTMIAPGAGELIQELILMTKTGLDIHELFGKIYPYPVASRVNQAIIVKHKEKRLTTFVRKMLRKSYRFLN
jgi:pyruvate/2-oxoglutarate dehydrogenase complex dihydrolipoamide dehydrogenase (E3) component